MSSSNASCSINSAGPFQSLLTNMVTMLLNAPCSIPNVYPRSIDLEDLEKLSFDFIVVGAGSTGSVVARRLAEQPSWNVLLIEAGDDPPIESDIPAFFPFALNPPTIYDYHSEPSPFACQGLRNERCFVPRGKAVGGTSAVNALLYARGSPHDYDGWQRLGNDGWDFDSLLPYFRRLETVAARLSNDDPAHGTGGPLNVERFPQTTHESIERIQRSLRSAAHELGLPLLKEGAVVPAAGVGKIWATLKRGVRENVAAAYLSSPQDRPNLKLLKKAFVTKLLIDSRQKVYGARVVRGAAHLDIVARREVVVSAGAINSPKLLMLSGIGPRDHLQQLGIDVVHDSKVGYNLQDHVAFVGAAYTCAGAQPPAASSPNPEQFRNFDDLYTYLTRRLQLSSVGDIDAVLYHDTTGRSPHYPDIQTYFIVLPAKSAQLYVFYEAMRIKPEIARQIMRFEGEHVVFPVMALLRPKSVGRVRLNSTDPFDKPLIDLGYFTDGRDRETLLEGIRLLDRLNGTDTFRRNKMKLEKIDAGDCAGSWACIMKYMSSTAFHQVGTCKMGPKSDSAAVVDSRLRVYGVEGLRVADASVMPAVVSGNTNIPCVMIGEKAADLIKSDWKQAGRNEL